MATAALQTPFCEVATQGMQKQFSDRPQVCISFVGAKVSPEKAPLRRLCNSQNSRCLCCCCRWATEPCIARIKHSRCTLSHDDWVLNMPFLESHCSTLSCSLQRKLSAVRRFSRPTPKIGTTTTTTTVSSSPVFAAACCCRYCCRLCTHSFCAQQLYSCICSSHQQSYPHRKKKAAGAA